MRRGRARPEEAGRERWEVCALGTAGPPGLWHRHLPGRLAAEQRPDTHRPFVGAKEDGVASARQPGPRNPAPAIGLSEGALSPPRLRPGW